MSDLAPQVRRVRGPVAAGEPCHHGAVRIRSRKDVVLDRPRRIRPLSVDALPALVKKHVGVAAARVQLGQISRDRRQQRVVPWSRTDTAARVCRPIAVVGVALHTQVRAPRAVAMAGGGGQTLTRRISATQAAQIAGGARCTRDEETDASARRGIRRAVFARDGQTHARKKDQSSTHSGIINYKCSGKPDIPSMRVTRTVLVIIAAAAASWLSLKAQGSEAIWAGVYTAAQAERGRTVIQNHCSECHHEDLSGGEGPALIGSAFMAKWETHSVERLFHKIRDTMPSRGSTEVSEAQKLDTVAYILQQNGFPAGNTELTDMPGHLASLKIVPKGGPAGPRPGALVRAIGCLQDSGKSQWTLVQSSEPQVTTLDPMSAGDKEAAAATPTGAQTIELLSVFPSPVAMTGHKVIAKGLFIKAPNAPRINVMSLESLAPTCGN